jgi:hypothetical protein
MGLEQAASGFAAGVAGALQPAGPGAMAPVVPGVHGPVGKERNWLVVVVVGSICFIAGFYYAWAMLNELKAFRQRDDINPILFFVPILNLLLLFQLPDKVLEAKRMAGISNASVQTGIIYLLLGWYFFPNDLNEIWKAAGGQPRQELQAYGA